MDVEEISWSFLLLYLLVMLGVILPFALWGSTKILALMGAIFPAQFSSFAPRGKSKDLSLEDPEGKSAKAATVMLILRSIVTISGTAALVKIGAGIGAAATAVWLVANLLAAMFIAAITLNFAVGPIRVSAGNSPRTEPEGIIDNKKSHASKGSWVGLVWHIALAGFFIFFTGYTIKKIAADTEFKEAVIRGDAPAIVYRWTREDSEVIGHVPPGTRVRVFVNQGWRTWQRISAPDVRRADGSVVRGFVQGETALGQR